MNTKIRPDGYWKDWKNVESELKRIIIEFGHFPSSEELKKRKLSVVAHAIFKYHGGMLVVREKFKEPSTTKQANYWKNFNNVLNEAKEILRVTGRKILPSSGKLRELGYTSFSSSVSLYHGGFERLRRILGEKPILRRRGYWEREGNIISEIKKLMEKEGWIKVPSKGLLEEKGYRDVSNAVMRYVGGFRQLRKLLNQAQIKTEDSIWRDFRYLIEKVNEAMKTEGWERLPNADVLHNSGYSGIANAISRYHGGYTLFRRKLNEYLGEPSENKQLESMLEEYTGG